MSETKGITSLKQLTQEEVKDAKMENVRTRPNSSSLYGARGMTGDELKRKFDEYPEKIRERLNQVIVALVESLTVNENEITPIAKQIMVVVNGFSTDAKADTLAHAIEVMIEKIIDSKESAARAIGIANGASTDAGGAIDIASGASTVAGSAIEIAHDAESVADNALQTANESKEIANDAYSYARTAEQGSAQAISLAESATSFANDAYKSAEDAIKIADEAIDIANRASEGIGFKTRAEMYAYINSMSWFKDYHFDRHAIIPKGSYVVVSIDFETKEYVNSYGEIEYVTPTSVDIVWDKRYENNGSVVVKSNRVYTVFKILDDIAFNDIFYQGFYTYNNAVDDRIYFNSNERIVITDKENPTYQEYGSYKIPYGTHMGIEEEGVPDYWWAGIRAVESEAKVNLKNYADKDFVAENYVPTATSQGIYAYDFLGKDENGNRIYGNKTINYSYDADTNGWRIVQRDGDGFINAKTPKSHNNVANKGYVDSSLVEVKNGLQSILDAVNGILEGGASA